ARAGAVLPRFFPKPPAWTSYLVTADNQGVKDGDFATWVKNAQTAVAPRTFKFIASFGTCYGGGFLTEFQNKGLTSWGANSASTYFEPVTIDSTRGRTYYNWAWKTIADVPPAFPTDEKITDDAYNAILAGNVGAIPANPYAKFERAQYNSDRAGAGAPPTDLGNAMHKFAILWVGQPSTKNYDLNDLNNLYAVLKNRYGFAPADIYILFGGPGAGAGLPKARDGQATSANLQFAFNNWLQGKINAQPQRDTNLVFFWAGDHGSVDSAITIEVDNAARGVAGSGVAAQRVAGKTGQTIYEAGSGTNVGLLLEPTGKNFKALSFGDDFQNPAALFATQYASPTAIVYFSVDGTSFGVDGSDVREERNANRLPGADIYAATANGNRRMFDGMANLGLLKVAPNFDDLNDFVLRDFRQAMNAQGQILRPLFFTNDQSSLIWVSDPVKNQTYVYYDFARNLPVRPWLVDALAVVANLKRRDPGGFLFFDPFKDFMLFSIGRQENMAPWTNYRPCDILRLGTGQLAVWQSCAQLGLDPTRDNVDGLDLGAGASGEPIAFDAEWPWPQYPYPNSPDGGDPTPPSPKSPPTDPIEILPPPPPPPPF
ncbi:MAG TPA: hypothetical protein VGR07_08420, partial [Thermoanaerobaculia bacterium]|nr:hypothetical protein [Thermoanaerobaculia bacterium]